jgi:rhodanese-related sulfurtransferase
LDGRCSAICSNGSPRSRSRDDANAVDYPRLRELLAGGAQLVEVLPEAEYREEHLPDAINIPLKSLARLSTAQLDKSRAVVVYCWDGL